MRTSKSYIIFILMGTLLLTGCGKEAKEIKKASSTSSPIPQHQNSDFLNLQAIEYALQADDTLLIRELLSDKNINALLPSGETSLTYAIKNNKLTIVREILNKKPDLNLSNADQETPLQIIVQNGLYYHFQLLTSSPLKLDLNQEVNGNRPIDLALKLRDEIMSIRLLKAGCLLDCAELVQCSIYHQSQQLGFHQLTTLIEVIIMLKNKNQLSSAHLIKKLLSKASADTIEYAVRHHKLKDYANGNNIISQIIKIENKEQKREILFTLIRNSFSTNGEPHDSEIPLITAIKYSCSDSLTYLLRNGADPNKLDSSHHSAMIHSAQKLAVDEVKLLLAYGAKRNYSYQMNEDAPRHEIDVCDFIPKISRGILRRNNLEDWNNAQEIKKVLQCN